MSSDSSLAPETQWVLARAFLPPDSSIDLPPDLGAIWPEATRLRMAPRIASRCGAARLARELGNQQAQLFATASRRAAVDAMRVAAQLRYLARTADRLGLRFAVLKGAAFHEAHLCLPGARPLADCDILCPRRDAVRLFEALLDDGWIQEVGWRTDYHLPPLHKDGALPLEIHDAIPLVVTKGRLWATYEDLEQCKSLDVTPGAGALVSVEFLRAHAIAHAVAQPERMTARTIAFLCSDLFDSGCQGVLGDRVRQVVGRYVPDQLLDDLERLLASLVGGDGDPSPRFLSASSCLWSCHLKVSTRMQGTAMPTVLPLPGCPSPLTCLVRNLCKVVFACKISLRRVYGRSGRETYARLLLRRYLALLRRLVN